MKTATYLLLINIFLFVACSKHVNKSNGPIDDTLKTFITENCYNFKEKELHYALKRLKSKSYDDSILYITNTNFKKKNTVKYKIEYYSKNNSASYKKSFDICIDDNELYFNKIQEKINGLAKKVYLYYSQNVLNSELTDSLQLLGTMEKPVLLFEIHMESLDNGKTLQCVTNITELILNVCIGEWEKLANKHFHKEFCELSYNERKAILNLCPFIVILKKNIPCYKLKTPPVNEKIIDSIKID